MDLIAAIWPLLVIGLVVGSVYSIAAAGLVLTYRASGVFNFGHGAIGAFSAFFYAWCVQRVGLPIGVAAVITMAVMAPLLGIALERSIFRRLREAPTVVAIVASIGVLVALQGAAAALWGRSGLSAQRIFPGRVFQIGDRVSIGADQAGVVGVGIVVSLLLWVVLKRTKMGIAMRAVVDRPDLVETMGYSADRISSASWAMGASLAAAAGILLTPMVSLEVYTLTLIVINAYAAAMVGRLESLPLTFAGGVLLGFGEALVGRFLPQGIAAGVLPSLPFALLLGLLIIPRTRPLREPRAAGIAASLGAWIPPLRREWPAKKRLGIVALIAAGMITLARLGADVTFAVDLALVHAILFLSLVLLVGYGGQISLAQAALAGVGGIVTAHLVTNLGWSWFAALPVAGLAAVPVGALLAYPALRLHGLFLGLATMAFSLLMDNAIFTRDALTGGSSGIAVPRPGVLQSDVRFGVVLTLIFALLAWGLHNLRRGRTGRILAAMRDSETGARSIGISPARTKLILFMMGAFIAGIGGSTYVAAFQRVDAGQFIVFYSIVWLAVAVIGGISTWAGALAGGLVYSIVPFLFDRIGHPAASDMIPVLFGAAAILLARNPRGIVTVPRRVREMVAGWMSRALAPFEEPADEPQEVRSA
ncbi:MAG TPA: ABC transporter permease [Actinomycetota bacterium]|nr:ABC transporter permease [Actinomycetota bacterium]